MGEKSVWSSGREEEGRSCVGNFIKVECLWNMYYCIDWQPSNEGLPQGKFCSVIAIVKIVTFQTHADEVIPKLD